MTRDEPSCCAWCGSAKIVLCDDTYDDPEYGPSGEVFYACEDCGETTTETGRKRTFGGEG